jgi:hypothetical protein
MVPEERFAEIGRILALGFARLRAGKSTTLFANDGDSCLDFSLHPRLDAETRRKRGA